MSDAGVPASALLPAGPQPGAPLPGLRPGSSAEPDPGGEGQAQAWLTHALRSLGEAVVLVDGAQRVRQLNPAAERLTGWSQAEAGGRPLVQVLRAAAGTPALDPVALLRHALQADRPGRGSQGLLLHDRAGDTRVVDLQAGPVRDAQGRALGAVLVLRDAAPRLAQLAQLRASEARFQALFDHAPQGLALLAPGGGIIRSNAALQALLGRGADALRATPLAALAHGDERQTEAALLAALLREAEAVAHGLVAGADEWSPRVQRYARRWPLADGRWCATQVSATVLAEADGRPGSLLLQVQPLPADPGPANPVLDAAPVPAPAAPAATDVLARTAHEMRTPLNAVIGFSELLRLQPADDPATVASYAQHILAAGEHLLALVDDLLEQPQASARRPRVLPEPVALRSVLDETLLLLLPTALEQGVILDDRVDDRPGDRSASALRVQADPTRLRQVLLNLGSNAVKYNRPGGQVRWQAWREPARPGVPAQVLLSVADDGIGMDAAQLQRPFQPRERLGREASGVAGSGLGLVIARELTQQMGGTLTLHSQPGEGTTATLALPAA